jgi:hypothetical protein
MSQPHFDTELDAASGRLRLAGVCRMSDVARLTAALADWQEAGPRQLDLSAAGSFDIGPAWLLHQFIADAAANAAPIVVHGDRVVHAGSS